MGLWGTLGQIVVLIILINLFSAIMMFFGIEFAVYGPYLSWFVAIFLFFKMFAGKKKSILE
jgi:hypothetical protein